MVADNPIVPPPKSNAPAWFEEGLTALYKQIERVQNMKRTLKGGGDMDDFEKEHEVARDIDLSDERRRRDSKSEAKTQSPPDAPKSLLFDDVNEFVHHPDV